MFATVGELLIFTIANWRMQLFLRHLTWTHQISLHFFGRVIGAPAICALTVLVSLELC